MRNLSVFFIAVAIALTFSLAIGGVQAVRAEKIKLTFATTMPPKSNLDVLSNKFVNIIKKRTSGRIEITHYGQSTLYHSKALIPALAKNQVNMGLLHVAMVGRRSPTLEFLGSFGAQGCWKDYDHYYRFIDNPEVLKIAESEFDKYFSAKLLSPWAFGTGFVGANRPIEAVEDFKGLKMRASGTAQAAMYRALGAIPTELSSKEQYTALQRGTIDGTTSGTSRFRRSKLYEVAPYITADPTCPFLTFWLAINKDVWADLSPDYQKLFLGVAKELQNESRVNATKEWKEDVDVMKEKAKKYIVLSKAEQKKLIETVKPAMREFSKKRLGDMYDKLWGLLEATK